MKRTGDQVEAFKAALVAGTSIHKAMIAAGYAEGTAVRGAAGLPPELLAIVIDMGRQYVDLGRKINPQEQEAFVRGRALAAAIEGSDRGAQMLKLLGSDRRVNMFVPDTQVGVIVVGESKRLDALEDVDVGLVLKGQGQEHTPPTPPTGEDL